MPPWTKNRPGRYERVDGEPVAMAPERIQHVRVKTRVWAAFDRAIAAADPLIVVEVLLPSTQSTETDEKLA